jgi:hypothetical protein
MVPAAGVSSPRADAPAALAAAVSVRPLGIVSGALTLSVPARTVHVVELQ